jgi:enoyl-CoA hydratase/carnithine racemase
MAVPYIGSTQQRNLAGRRAGRPSEIDSRPGEKLALALPRASADGRGRSAKEINAMSNMPNPESTPLLEVEHAIATVTFNRPAKQNALDYGAIDRLLQFLDLIEAKDGIRAVILTGAGDRAFSAGADIRDLAASVEAGAETALRDFVRRGQSLTRRIEGFPKPVIAAVNGLAYGAGCEIVEACALAVAADTATFAKPEIDLGFPPPFGGTQRLPRLIGRKRALGMILTGEPVSAAQAAEMGLVNAVVSASALMKQARELALRIADKSALAVAACLASVTRGLNVPIDEGLAVEAQHFARMVSTWDIGEGIHAFLERRPAKFVGR